MEDEAVQALVEKYDALSKSDRQALTITDLCAAVDLKFSRLLGAVTAHAFEHNSDVSKLMAAVWQPAVVMKATIESAVKYLGPDGVKDRQMLVTHSNFSPVPRSDTTIFNLQQQINNSREASGEEPTRLPTFEEDVMRFSAARRGHLFPATVNAEKQAWTDPKPLFNGKDLAGWVPARAKLVFILRQSVLCSSAQAGLLQPSSPQRKAVILNQSRPMINIGQSGESLPCAPLSPLSGRYC